VSTAGDEEELEFGTPFLTLRPINQSINISAQNSHVLVLGVNERAKSCQVQRICQGKREKRKPNPFLICVLFGLELAGRVCCAPPVE
jgi:hypothetical protein